MAQPTNTFDTYDSIGEREDLSDVIYNISPTDTPFLSSAAKTKSTAVLHEWQTDSLASAVTNRGTQGSRSEHRRVSLDHHLARSASESLDLDSADLASE